MVRAVACREWGEPASLRLEELARPPLAAGEVRIGVRAAGVNFADLLMVRGQYQERPPFPFAPGLEVAGEVLEAAPGVEVPRVGDRVFALLDRGGYAEEAVARAVDTYLLPPAMTFEGAAGFGIAYATSHVGLRHLARLEAGETLLVHGAAGGVGLTAVEVGKAAGARVIASARGAERLEVARAHGADELVDHASESIRERVLTLTDGRGVDVVFDPVGGDAFEQSLRCVAWGARILLVGFASGDVPQIPANHLLVKNVSAIGFTIGTYRERAPEVLRAAFAELFAWHAEGKVRPQVTRTLPLEQAVEALQLLAERAVTGKVVLTP